MRWLKHFHKIVLCAVVIFSSVVTNAQSDTLEIFEIEYFFDVDPGFGGGTSILVSPADSTPNVTETIATSGLSTGFHALGMRARNIATNPKYNVVDTGTLIRRPFLYIDPSLRSAGQWGMTETRLVFVDQSNAGQVVNVDQLEYFFDTDPGVGSATLINSFALNPTIAVVESLGSNALPTGFHSLGMRARAEGGAWGITETRLVFVDQSNGGAIVNVDALEYFFDEDPGIGSATIVDGFTVENSVSLIERLNTSTIATGFHSLGMRARSEGGAWGITETRLVFVDPSNAGAIVSIDELEYFFDEDPGVGNGTPISSFSPSSSVSIVENINTNGLSLGFHVLGMRGRAEGGSWGTTETRMLYVDQSNILNDVTEIEYFIETDPGVGSASNVTVETSGIDITETFALSTDALPIGSHVVYARVMNQDGIWGMTESRAFEITDVSAPTISSSQSTPTNSSSIDLQIAFEEAVTSFDQSDLEISTGGSIQGGSFTAVNDSTFTFVMNLDTEGVITLDITDSAAFTLNEGKPTPPAETFEIVYDITVPVVTIDTLITIDTSPELTGTVDDDSVSVEITVDGAVYAASSVSGGSWVLDAGVTTSLRNGTYDVSVEATDFAGNVGTDATTDELTIDILELTIDTLSTTDSSPQLTGTVTDITSTVTVTVDATSYSATVNVDGSWILSSGTIDPPLAEGVYDVIAEADRGVEGTITDLTTNELTILNLDVLTTVDPLSTNNRSPALTGTISELSATIEITIDGTTYSAINDGDNTWSLAAGIITPNLSDGIYDVEVLADAGGNLGSDSTINEIRVDGTAPIITVDLVATSISSPALSGGIDDPDASIEVIIDGNSYVPVNNGDNTWSLLESIITPALVDGTYSIDATATDSLGNQGVDITSDELIITSTLLALPATGVSPTTFIASWSQGEDVLNYELDVSTSSDFSSFLSGYDGLEVSTTSTTINDLDFATSYYYRVRLVNTASEVSDNSNSISLKTFIDAETIADSTALVQIYEALNGSNWTTPVNWETARLREWDGVSLDATKTRIDQIDISSQEASGSIPNPFGGDAVGGLSVISSMNLRNNQIEGLMDFDETSISSLDVSSNALDFGDLEPLIGIPSLTYATQANLFFDQSTGGDPIETPHLSDAVLVVNAGEATNTYTFFRNGETIVIGTDFDIADSVLTIKSIDFDNMGEFRVEVTNAQLPDLTLEVEPQLMYAVADLSMTIVDGAGNPLAETISGFLLETVKRSQGYDTLKRANDVASSFTFSNVILGDYLCAIDPSNTNLYIPTYFGDEFEWTLAETIFFREANNVQVIMTEIPGDPIMGPGVLDILIEEDFPEQGGRIDARRRAAKRKCGLRRKTGGGRTEADEFELIAYGETNDNGEFQFGFLPEGTYRFFVEYPGIPLDELSVVEFEVGEEGISDTDFKLEAFVNEDGIVVTIDRVLGVILTYFKNLQVYPNPTRDLVKISYRHLKSESVSAQLLDLSGNVLRALQIKNGFDGYEEIDVSDLSEGIYLLHIFDDSDKEASVVTYRLMIKK